MDIGIFANIRKYKLHYPQVGMLDDCLVVDHKSSLGGWMEINNNIQELQEGAKFPKRKFLKSG